MWRRSLILVGLVEAFKIFAQDKVHPLLLTIQLVFMKLWMSLVKGFFALFTKTKNATQLEGFFIDENDDVWMRLPSGQWTLLGSDQHVLRDEPG